MKTEEANTLLNLSQIVATADLDNPRVRDATNYRSGNYVAAISDLNKSAKVYTRRVWDWIFLALAQQKLGKTVGAKESLNKAVEWIDQANRTRSPNSTAPWVAWTEPSEVEQRLSEARAMIR